MQNPSWARRPDGFFNFSINQDLAFSLVLRPEIFYPAIILVLFIIFHYWYKNYKNRGLLWWPWSLLIIGAISNLLDRIYYGGVIDFLHIPGLTVFNISDVYISVAVAWLLLHSLWAKSDKKV